MTTRAMGTNQIRQFTQFCEAQGIGVTRTKKGLFLRFPDGSSTVQHFTTSDTKAVNNQIARFRRAGVVHPDDPRGPKGLADYITSGKIGETTRKTLIKHIIDSGYPGVVYAPDIVKALNWEPSQVNRALYHTGFRAGPVKNRRQPRPWYTPDDILDLEKQAEQNVPALKQPVNVLMDMAERARKAQAAVDELGAGRPEPAVQQEQDAKAILEGRPEGHAEEAERLLNEEMARRNQPKVEQTPEAVEKALGAAVEGAREAGRQVAQGMKDLGAIPPTPTVVHDPVIDEAEVTVQKDGEREFIDSHESWTVDLAELLGNQRMRIVDDQLKVLAALGLEYEFRVWRKK